MLLRERFNPHKILWDQMGFEPKTCHWALSRGAAHELHIAALRGGLRKIPKSTDFFSEKSANFKIWNSKFWWEDSTDPLRMPVIFGGGRKLSDPGMHVKNKVCWVFTCNWGKPERALHRHAERDLCLSICMYVCMYVSVIP